jgi:hypothetical protein
MSSRARRDDGSAGSTGGSRQRGRLILVASLSAAIAAASVSSLAGPPAAGADEAPAPPGRGLRFEPSGIKAGGFFTSVAIAPGASGTIVLAGGNSGYHRSTDLGATFSARNRDLITLPYMRVASVAYHPTRPGVLYGASGNRGQSGGIARSTDDGLTWQVISTEPLFAGQDNSGIADLPEHPRSTGALIAAYEDTLWVGTFQQGVMRSTDDGTTWQVIGLPGALIRSLVADPSDPDVLYVSTWRDGVYVTDGARAEVVAFRAIPGAPLTVEELAAVGESLYAAAGTDGLFRLDGDRWTALGNGVPTGSTWAAIAGIETPGGPLLFAGCSACAPDGSGDVATIIRSTDGCASWHNVTAPENLRFEVVGSGERWVMADGVPDYMPGAPDAIVSQIVVKARSDADEALVAWAGRGGMWRSTDSGQTWAPAVNGLSEANSEGLAIDPSDPGRVFQGAAHFGLQASMDAFATVHIDALDALAPLSTGTHPTAIWTAFDTAVRPADVIIAAGDSQDGTVGGVYRSSDPFSRDAWADLGFTAAVPGKQPTSLAVGYDAEGARVIVAAAQPKGGLVRKVGDGPWLPVVGTDAFTKGSPAKSDMLWPDGTSIVYAYDLGQGIYRSNDRGLTFDPIWEHASEAPGTGAMAARPGDPGTLYVAAEDGLYRLVGADASSVEAGGIIVTRMDDRAISDVYLTREGALWAVAHPSATAATTVLLVAEPDQDETPIQEFTDDTLANTMVVPETLAVTDDGIVLVGGLRSGTLRGVPIVEPEAR